MEAVITLAILMTGAVCSFCFYVGAKVGMRVTKDEPIELPSINPMKAYRDKKDREEAKAEQEKLDKILRNVERYNGTSEGQEDV